MKRHVLSIFSEFVKAPNRLSNVQVVKKKNKKKNSPQFDFLVPVLMPVLTNTKTKRWGISFYGVELFVCAAALNKADCVLLHFPARALSSAFKFENPGVK